MNQPDRYGVQKVMFLATRPTCQDETRVFQDTQVFHDAEAGHGQRRLEFTQSLAVPLEELIQQQAARRISQGFEYSLFIQHVLILGDQKVTCQIVIPLLRHQNSDSCHAGLE